MKKRLFRQTAKSYIKRNSFKDRASWRRALNLIRKHLVRGWRMPKMCDGKLINYAI